MQDLAVIFVFGVLAFIYDSHNNDNIIIKDVINS